VTNITVATIGFTKSTAENFFGRLARASVRTVIDVRLHNTSQLAGFAKADDLVFFLSRLDGIAYRHEPLLAPTSEMLDKYKKQKDGWDAYCADFMNLMRERGIEKCLQPQGFVGACLLCSEATPHHCHRRLVCDYLNDKWGGLLNVEHL